MVCIAHQFFFSCIHVGGWCAIMCPCGVVYSLKFLIRAESPRDYADLLLSWKHLPYICIYDFARGLVAHTNVTRAPDIVPFQPFEGRLLEPTTENISMAREGKIFSHLSWVREKKETPDENGHPITTLCCTTRFMSPTPKTQGTS